jgi:hypothetical protein
VSTPGAESSRAAVEKIDGERFVVPEEQDDDEDVGATIATDEIDKDEVT